MDRPVDSETLRSTVREVLRDLLPTLTGQAPAAARGPRAGQAASVRTRPAAGGARSEEVSITNDQELAAFVQRLLHLFADPGAREALRTGRHAFRLVAAAPHPGLPCSAAPPAASAGESERFDQAVLSESKVISLARAGRRIVLGERVVVTPLARDKARQLGVKLEREK